MSISFLQKLFMIYINSAGDSYDFSEIIDIMGMTTKQFMVFLKEMMKLSLIEYNKNNLLCVSEHGISILETNAENNIEFEQLFHERTEIGRPKLTLDDVYVPKHFDKKV